MKAIAIGAGHWHAPWHVKALAARGIPVVGVWDADAAVAAQRAADWGASAGAVDELIAARPDLALLAPRAIDAPELLARLMIAGIPVIAEKPLGISAEDVVDLARLRAEHEAFVAVTLVNRLSPVWEDAPLRDVVGADFRIVNGTAQRYVDDGVGWVLDPRLGGGGALRNLGIHGADAICALAGEDELTVDSANLLRVPEWDVEVHATAAVHCSAGWTATVEAGYVLPDRGGSDFEWRVATRDRYLVDRDAVLVISDRGGTRAIPAPTSAQRYDAFIGRALDDLAAGRAPLAGLDHVARAARLVDAIYATAAAPVGPHNPEGER